MSPQRVIYPVGQQSFELLREDGCLYVDKTPVLARLLNESGRYYFLSRPRRFGKSLFLSMLNCFFRGKRHLFKGLYIDSVCGDWSGSPVLHLDLNVGEYDKPDGLKAVLDAALRRWQREFGIKLDSGYNANRFSQLISEIHRVSGKRVVILVDEYDKPLVNNIHSPELAIRFRNELSAFYANFKSGADHIRFAFLTGVSKFGHLSVFSGLNNINDISFDDNYSDICGVTLDELRRDFTAGIAAMAEKEHTTVQAVTRRLIDLYGGYRFSTGGVEICNPFSLILAMSKCRCANYWIESGMPTLLVEKLKDSNADLKKITDEHTDAEGLKSIDSGPSQVAALLYQTGYLTIKSFDPEFGIIGLGLPNAEVKKGFLNFLLPAYADVKGESTAFIASNFVKDFREGRPDSAMRRMQSLFSGTSYRMELGNERNLHNAIYILITLVGLDVHTEMETSEGRIDLLVRTPGFIYIIELKFDHPAADALQQIKQKHYALPFFDAGQRIFMIGVEYSSERRTIAEWQIEELQN